MQGDDLDQETPYAVLMARDLAKQLDLGPKSDAVLMAPTLEGQMNALDIRINGTYDTGSEATNNKYLLLPYSYAQSLYDTDRADRLIVLLDHWRHTRTARDRLAQGLAAAGLRCEMELITAYLDLFKVRMGDRLQVRIEMDDALKPAPFAPMLIQPLVENAILHGLEESIDGGIIIVLAEQADSTLRVTVSDTGKGFASETSPGLVLANVRDRLKALYGELGRLVITENQPNGVQAVVEVPYAAGD